ncbi:MAG TPA: beta-propeller domain-containing protein [Acidimicrobiales bacterium]|nr:beta-propeller domain-containing protein [Acidimicrobiales bacterium]
MSDPTPSGWTDRLRRLSARGDARGADDVFAAASADASSPAPAPTVVPLYRNPRALTTIAATVMVLAGIVAALNVGDGNGRDAVSRRALGTTSSTLTPGATTPTTLDGNTKVYLASTRLVPFNQCGTLASYAKAQALKDVGPNGLPGVGTVGITDQRMMANAAGTASGDTAAPKAESSTSAPAYSDTNVQEAGIDEPDSVKTDGHTVYQIANGRVFATSAGDNPQLLGSLAVDGATEMLRIADRLIVVSPGGVYYPASGGAVARPMAGGDVASPYPGGGTSSQSRFTVVDVSNPKAMKVTGHLDVDGSYVSARTVNGVARLVVRSSPNLTFSYPQDGTTEAEAAAKEHNASVIRGAAADVWLPHYTATDASGREQTGKTFACGDSYHPPQFSGFGMLSVLSFNTENPSYTRAASVMGDGDIVYASDTRVYVATNAWSSVTPASNSFAPSSSTLIHAFDISDPVQAVYRESGRVNGTVLNQFSMSEYKGALRVATTDAGNGSESFVTVLGDSGSALVPVGQVGGLGKGERIYAVRFIGPVGYVVTFRQFDPLYVVDLSDPTKPRVTGSLEVSGYSAYLHPISDGLLLAVGAEVKQGEPDGVQMSLYDVHDPTSPKLLARSDFGTGFSGAAGNFDHHAFLYWPATKLAVVPLQTYGGYTTPDGSTPSSQAFNGAIGMHVGDSSISEVGRAQAPANGQYGQPNIERSVVIGDHLYFTTAQGLLVTRLDNLQQTAFVSYPQP